MPEIIALLSGTFYGLLIGIIPGAGATTGLIFLFSFITLFPDPYLAVIFVMAVVAASTTGDTYTGVLLGIPGANSAAATMIDGFPLALQGKATYAISAAVTTSTINGLLWGSLTFFLLPWYTNLILIFGVPELWAFTMLALATVTFISNKWWVRGLIALAAGIFIGMIGVDPNTNADRWTGGWEYLGAGVQLLPMIAGLFAIPELIDGLARRRNTADSTISNGRQTLDGIKAVWDNKWLALRGGCIGAFIGVLPGLGGAMADWLAYGATVAANPKEKFGVGNVKGVIGAEGANNAQKASSFIPTVLFGIPGASFAAILMGLFLYLGIDLGSPDTFYDDRLFDSMTFAFLLGTIITAVICYGLAYFAGWVTRIPYVYYFPFILAVIVWATLQYTGGWEDLAVLVAFSILGLLCKKFQVSRPALLIGYLLSDRIYNLTYQLTSLHTVNDMITRPIFIFIMICVILLLYWGITKRSRLDYA